MTKIILTGATGNAGSGILSTAIASPSISHITILSRRPVPIPDSPKVSTIIIPSEKYPRGFEECPKELVDTLKGHSAIIWAQGISQMQVKQDEYIKITHDYPMAFAQGLKSLGTPTEPFKFIYISGEGADQSEKGRQLFSRIKGKTEKELQALENDSEGFKVVSVRPGGIKPTPEHKKHMSYLMSAFNTGAYAIFGTLAPSLVIPSTDLGKATVDLATSNKSWNERHAEGWMNNVMLRKIAADYDSSLGGN